MKRSNGVVRGLRRTPLIARATVAIIATAALVSLVAGCGGGSSAASGGSSSAGGSSTKHLAWAYSRCMRSHGDTRYPDPGPARTDYVVPVIPPTPGEAADVGISVGRLRAADHACQHLLPPPTNKISQIAQCTLEDDCSQALMQRYMQALYPFARCMRAHGIPNWPDPTLIASGDKPHSYPGFYIPRNAGFNPHSSQVMNIMNGKCDHVAGITDIAINGPGA